MLEYFPLQNKVKALFKQEAHILDETESRADFDFALKLDSITGELKTESASEKMFNIAFTFGITL